MNGNAKAFLDTNLFIYAHTNVDELKQHKIQQIVSTENTVISTQVLNETANVLYKKFRLPLDSIQRVLVEMEQNNEVYILKPDTIRAACDIQHNTIFHSMTV